MQTWARRGFQAALVTGGVLAAGSAVASATQTGPGRAGPDLDHSGDGTPRHFAGDLFTDVTAPVTALAGHLDPVRDVLPHVEDAPTREMPALTEQGWVAPRRSVQPVGGQHAAPDPDARTVQFRVDGGRATRTVPLRRGQHGLHAQPRAAGRGRHAAPASGGSPSDGFPRSLSWHGPIGGVLQDQAQQGLLAPVHELATAQDDPAQNSSAQTSPVLPVVDARPVPALGGLIAPEAVDLTSGRLAPTTTTRTVPHDVVARAATHRPRPVQPAETVPLQVPGEHQERATDVPAITGALLADPPAGQVARPAPEPEPLSRITGALLGEPEPAAPQQAVPQQAVPQQAVPQQVASQQDEPTVRIAAPQGRSSAAHEGRAAEPPAPRLPGFTDRPLQVPATARHIDPLAAIKAERDHVADNPYRSEIRTHRAAPGGLGMALPLLDGVTRRAAPEHPEITDVLPVLSAT